MDSDERRFRALDFLLDYSKGTLWRVKDCIWDKAIKGFVVKRKEHPGLSIGCRRMASLYDTVPMLIGTTKNSGMSVPVKNFYGDPESKDRITHFGVLRPYPIRFNEFGASESVVSNSAKPRIEDIEMKDLNRILKVVGVANG